MKRRLVSSRRFFCCAFPSAGGKRSCSRAFRCRSGRLPSSDGTVGPSATRGAEGEPERIGSESIRLPCR
jgi:hypothetical protein